MRQLILIGFVFSFFNAAGQFTLKKLVETSITPVRTVDKGKGTYFLDFGKAAFGTLAFSAPLSLTDSVINVILSESLSDENLPEVHPKGTIRSWQGKLKLRKFNDYYILDLPQFSYPRGFVPIPHDIKNILPFRYCQLSGLSVGLDIRTVKQLAIWYPFNDQASDFSSSSDTLNRIWDLCKYSIKATTFCGVYVDGDRERKPYEADAYINQLGHYCVDSEYALARYTQEFFFDHPTWPTEWKSHSVLMAWEDYMYTGNADFLFRFYDRLKNEKLQPETLSPEGLLVCSLTGQRPNDIIDWPMVERDNYDLKEINLVPNAFYYRSLVLMAKIAHITHHTEDEQLFLRQAKQLKSNIQTYFYNSETGLYVDAVGSLHHSLHANLFPLVFDLIPEKNKPVVIRFLKSKGMVCSVYAAQYLLDGLYAAGEGDYALKLLCSPDKRGWVNMLRAGTTITMEAWDQEFKPNLDWNHAWGSAPANIIPRGVFGIQPLEPGYKKFQIKLQTSELKYGNIRLPTVKGNILVSFENILKKRTYLVKLIVPPNSLAELSIPNLYNGFLIINGQREYRGIYNEYIKLELSPGSYQIISSESNNINKLK